MAGLGVPVALAFVAKLGAHTPFWLQTIGAYLVAAGVVLVAGLLFRYREITWGNALGELVLAAGLGVWTILVAYFIHRLLGGGTEPVGVALVVSLLFLIRAPVRGDGDNGEDH